MWKGTSKLYDYSGRFHYESSHNSAYLVYNDRIFYVGRSGSSSNNQYVIGLYEITDSTIVTLYSSNIAIVSNAAGVADPYFIGAAIRDNVIYAAWVINTGTSSSEQYSIRSCKIENFSQQTEYTSTSRDSSLKNGYVFMYDLKVWTNSAWHFDLRDGTEHSESNPSYISKVFNRNSASNSIREYGCSNLSNDKFIYAYENWGSPTEGRQMQGDLSIKCHFLEKVDGTPTYRPLEIYLNVNVREQIANNYYQASVVPTMYTRQMIFVLTDRYIQTSINFQWGNIGSSSSSGQGYKHAAVVIDLDKATNGCVAGVESMQLYNGDYYVKDTFRQKVLTNVDLTYPYVLITDKGSNTSSTYRRLKMRTTLFGIPRLQSSEASLGDYYIRVK